MSTSPKIFKIQRHLFFRVYATTLDGAILRLLRRFQRTEMESDSNADPDNAINCKLRGTAAFRGDLAACTLFNQPDHAAASID